MRQLYAFLFLFLFGMAAFGQSEADSVMVMGSVTDRLTGEPLPLGYVHFLGTDGDTVATALCDTGGFFAVGYMPVGTYALFVSVKGLSLYRADLVLNDNADLHLSVITDSFYLRNLREVQIVEPKHELASSGLLITSPDDPRLWDFMYCDWCLWEQKPHYGGADAGFLPGQFYAPAKGSKMARIWQIFWPDRITPAPKEKQAGEKEKGEPVGGIK